MEVPEFNPEEHDVMLWIGCAGAYNPRYQKVVKSFATLMERAGLKWGCIGDAEQCTGDSARRAGNEFLAQMMIKMNVETMNDMGVKNIVTACPHCFNGLKNEYPEFGGDWNVEHHAEMLSRLVSEGKLKPGEVDAKKVTYHDSCYLGRSNDIYDQPRDILKSIKGIETTEMERSRSKGFCCGAGGAQMFMEEDEGTRVNAERTKEAVATGADTIASACPFCMTMLEDGVNDKGADVKVLDIAELLEQATTPIL